MITLSSWIASAEPGCRCIYARDDGEKVVPNRDVLGEARRLADAGQVLLFHQREKTGTMAYIAHRVGGKARGKIVDAAPKVKVPAVVRDDRIVAMLRQGKTYAEIGEALGMSVKAVTYATYKMRRDGRTVPEVRQGRPRRDAATAAAVQP